MDSFLPSDMSDMDPTHPNANGRQQISRPPVPFLHSQNHLPQKDLQSPPTPKVRTDVDPGQPHADERQLVSRPPTAIYPAQYHLPQDDSMCPSRPGTTPVQSEEHWINPLYERGEAVDGVDPMHLDASGRQLRISGKQPVPMPPTAAYFPNSQFRLEDSKCPLWPDIFPAQSAFSWINPLNKSGEDNSFMVPGNRHNYGGQLVLRSPQRQTLKENSQSMSWPPGLSHNVARHPHLAYQQEPPRQPTPFCLPQIHQHKQHLQSQALPAATTSLSIANLRPPRTSRNPCSHGSASTLHFFQASPRLLQPSLKPYPPGSAPTLCSFQASTRLPQLSYNPPYLGRTSILPSFQASSHLLQPRHNPPVSKKESIPRAHLEIPRQPQPDHIPPPPQDGTLHGGSADALERANQGSRSVEQQGEPDVSVPVFTAGSGQFWNWTSKLAGRAAATGLSVRQLLELAQEQSTGAVPHELRRLLAWKPDVTWPQAYQFLRRNFAWGEDCPSAEEKLLGLSQGDNERFTGFAGRIHLWAKDVYFSAELLTSKVQRKLIDLFIGGLRDVAVARAVEEAAPRTFHEILKIARFITVGSALLRKHERLRKELSSSSTANGQESLEGRSQPGLQWPPNSGSSRPTENDCDQQGRFCLLCLMYGHSAPDCSELERQQFLNKTVLQSEVVDCWQCSGYGHIMRHCPYRGSACP